MIYTYDVKWERSDLPWTNRWDVYLKGNPEDEIHYFSIVNSLMIVLFLSGVVAMIMLRTLHKDISSYNEMQTLEEAQEESGWKLVHGDVFRPPSTSPLLLSVVAGSGVQILCMTICTMVCALFGLTSPANRGGLLTTLLLLYVFMGSFAGYSSARVYKLCAGKEWKNNTILTAMFYPGVMGAIFLAINSFVAYHGSSTAAPFTTLLALVLLWIGISTPLVFIGSYFGFKAETITTPVRTNQIARHIPEQVWYTHPLFSVALGGILPFGAVCIELFFIMSAMWLHQVMTMLSYTLLINLAGVNTPRFDCVFKYIVHAPLPTIICFFSSTSSSASCSSSYLSLW
ncbi:transmembrane 9 family protein [archaeon]|nr:MAG: transmembrane 9 family protein [archaeon]